MGIKTETLGQNNLFVISDLHLGDRTNKDRFIKTGKERLFMQFLEYVQKQEGQLIITGDLFELWRFSLEHVTDQWHKLLDILYQMNTIFIPGNHDAVVAAPHTHCMHPFFACVHEPFTAQLANKRFRFMHGHEIDPLQPNCLQKFGQNLGIYSFLFDIKDALLDLTNFAMSDVLYDIAENLLKLWYFISRNSKHIIKNEIEHIKNSSIRVQKMLTRLLQHREEILYDIAVAGHTHKPGQFGHWYYNSGSWTRPVNNFLKIWPDGHTAVFDWDSSGHHPNNTII